MNDKKTHELNTSIYWIMTAIVFMLVVSISIFIIGAFFSEKDISSLLANYGSFIGGIFGTIAAFINIAFFYYISNKLHKDMYSSVLKSNEIISKQYTYEQLTKHLEKFKNKYLELAIAYTYNDFENTIRGKYLHNEIKYTVDLYTKIITNILPQCIDCPSYEVLKNISLSELTVNFDPNEYLDDIDKFIDTAHQCIMKELSKRS